jgi:enamine deaminase RidA (YjgF/YER057c/UK114 family)
MSKPSKEFINPKALAAPPGYSHVAKVNKGTMIYLAGQVPCDASGQLVGAGDVEAQAEQVYRNIKAAIEAAGGTMADIVKLTTYILAEVDPVNITRLRAVRDRYVNTRQPPASTLLYISRLAQPGWLIEVEAVAAIDG